MKTEIYELLIDALEPANIFKIMGTAWIGYPKGHQVSMSIVSWGSGNHGQPVFQEQCDKHRPGYGDGLRVGQEHIRKLHTMSRPTPLGMPQELDT